ncbi:pectin lyase fold/virulence factor [Cadophora sp. MPI-SDFR-AT-0126]|nr:pectin lyase fold/virulence factor [Leotiomycetes sp. MPI-SDFR-AT-0126]
MKLKLPFRLTLLALLFVTIKAQLSGPVGPTTSTATKAAKKICSVLNYGAKADNRTDVGPAITAAYAACKGGGIVWIPSGDYAMSTWATLSGGSGWALQLDGILYRASTTGGHMIVVQNTNDFEFFSRTSQGAMQGFGYTFHITNTYGPRLIRLVKVTNFSLHDLKLVDSPAFHLIVDNCSNGEMYNLVIKGGNRGGLDGIDTSGSNIWYHDIEVSNKDECVTIKSPSKNVLIENIYCNWSGGCAFGSLGTGTAIEKIEYNNIYTWQSNQMMMIKSNGGGGYVRDCTFTNFIGWSNAYALDINEAWSQRKIDPGNGVKMSNLTFAHWKGTIIDAKRPSIYLVCSDKEPCTGIKVEDVAFWTDSGASMKYLCQSAYGTGYCLRSGSGGAYTVTQTVSTAPTGYKGPKMEGDLKEGLGLSKSIDVPKAIATSFFPGVAAKKALLNGSGGGAT